MNPTLPLVSIIIPVYNVEAYLRECLLSAVAQTYERFEIIIVDDGSSDNSPAICDEFKADYPALVKVIHKSNGGLSSARNRGIEEASGDYIAFIDSDDIVPQAMIENLVEGLSFDKNTMIVNGMINRVDINGKNVEEMRPKHWHRDNIQVVKGRDFGIAMFKESSNHYVWSKLYDARLFSKVRFIEGRNDEDTLLMYDLSRVFRDSNYTMVEIPHTIYYYRLVPNSICNNIQRPHFVARLKNLESLRSDSATSMPELFEHINLLYIRSYIWWLKQMIKNKEWNDYFLRYTENLKTIQREDAKKALSKRDYSFFFLSRYLPTPSKKLFLLYQRVFVS